MSLLLAWLSIILCINGLYYRGRHYPFPTPELHVMLILLLFCGLAYYALNLPGRRKEEEKKKKGRRKKGQGEEERKGIVLMLLLMNIYHACCSNLLDRQLPFVS